MGEMAYTAGCYHLHLDSGSDCTQQGTSKCIS